MAIKLLQGLDYKGNQPNFVRDLVATKAELFSSKNLKNYPSIYEVFCLEDGCKYRLDKERHETDPETGKWRKVAEVWSPDDPSPSGGGMNLWYGTDQELTPEEEASLPKGTLMFVNYTSTGVTKIYNKTEDDKDLITEMYTKSQIDTMIASIIRNLPYVAPATSLTSTAPTIIAYGETINSVTLALKASSSVEYIDITKVELFRGETLLKDDFDLSLNQWSFTYDAAAIIDDTTFRLKVTDSTDRTKSNTVDINFVHPSYTGATDSFDPDNIDTSEYTSRLLASKSFNWTGITCNNQYLVYMYPKAYGNLSSIVDENNFNITNGFTRVERQLNGVDYNIYYTNDSCSLNNSRINFT